MLSRNGPVISPDVIKHAANLHQNGHRLCDISKLKKLSLIAGTHSAVSNESDLRCMSDCRSSFREFDPGLVPYFHGD